MGHVILTVDASAAVRQMVSFTLNGAGYEVIEAEKYKDAHVELLETKVDLVLADLNMPNENANEFINEILGHIRQKSIPIIFMTSESHAAQKQLFDDSVAAWIEKPLKPDRLVSIVKKSLNHIQ